MKPTQQLLQHTFNLPSFRPGQEAVIDTLLAGRSALAVFPTGGGKSLCYQLPALLLDGLTLVVSPLVALMKDQVDQLNALNIPAARLDSTVLADELQAIYRGLEQGSIKLLYVAPERLSNEHFLSRLQRMSISLMAVDEAHCVSEWGHNFRPDYLKLAELAQTLSVGRVLALTATATPAVAEQICSSFGIVGSDHIQTGFYRSNLALNISPCTIQDRDPQLLARLMEQPSQASIVYVTLQKTADALAERLRAQGLNAGAYHAGLQDDQRHQVQEAFMRGDISIVVATIAFGMGIDKADIRAVYHYNLPKSLENYMQEVGRAGRDGQPAHCELFACPDDLSVLENFTYGDTPEPVATAGLIDWVLAQAPIFDLAVHELAWQFDLRPLVVNTLLTYLELEGVIHATAAFYTDYKIAFETEQGDVLGRFDERRADFLGRLFASGKAGRKWLTIRPADSAQQLGEERQRIVKALNYLEEQGLVKLQLAGVRKGYRLEQQPAQARELLARLNKLFSQREERDISRLHQVCEWAETDGCYQQSLVAYFGETLAAPCGQCSACRGHDARLPARRVRTVDTALIDSVMVEGHEALAQPRQLARFLCGITSPQASRARLGRHPQFAALAEAPFGEVLSACETALRRRD